MSSIDLTRFHQTFFEESFEGVETMEQSLLKLEPGVDNAELVNTIFRAAHSIKGGSSTFGFSVVATFTHHLETLLDLVRGGKRGVDEALVDLLLRANDVVRDLLSAARDHADYDAGQAQAIEAALCEAVEGRPVVEAAAAAVPAEASAVEGWRVRFEPHGDLFLSGNDPLLILRDLAGLGEIETTLDAGRLPPLAELDPETCYFAWTAALNADVGENDIRNSFAWVEDECELDIAPMAVVAEPEPEPEAEVVVVLDAEPEPTPRPAPEAAAKAPPPVSKAVPIQSAAKSATKSAAKPAAAATPESTIRVATDKIDALINLVGEIVITQSMLAQASRDLDPLENEKLVAGLQQLDMHTRRLQEAVMATRMLPIEAVFSRFPRMLRDLTSRLGKKVRLQTHGEGTELDKGVIEKIVDPLTHLIRNSVDHGIEMPEERLAQGKPETGTVDLRAAHEGGHIVIEISDDGRGLDRERILAKATERGLVLPENPTDSEVWQLIFSPGLSTAKAVTDVSGRGVGMDVVKRNILALGGQVQVESKLGEGTTVAIRLPLTLAILDGMSVSVGGEIFMIPLNCVVESLRPVEEQLRSVAGTGTVVRIRDEYLPLMRLYEMFGIGTEVRDPRQGIVVVLEAEGRKVALLVDDLVGQQQVVIKNLETNYHRIHGVSGATILGDGRVALIIDAAEMVRSTQLRAAA